MNIEDYKALKEQEATKEAKPTEAQAQVKVEEKQEEPKTEVFDIDGVEVTIDELTKGYLRQSDYTKKTTDIATQKKELSNAVAIYEQVQNSPKLREQLKNAGIDGKVLKTTTAEHKRIVDLEQQLASIELDSKLTTLKAKYPDFNETKVINEAAKRGITDLEFIYKATRDEKSIAKKADNAGLKEQLLAELKEELGLKAPTVPPTMMNGKKAGGAIKANEDGPAISPAELRAAKQFGMTPEEYIRNRDM